MYYLILHTIPKEKREALIQYCRLAQHKDATFKFHMKNNHIIIECPGRNIAYRRGMLFHGRFGCYFEVEKAKP